MNMQSQLGFDALLEKADQDNRTRTLEKRIGHLRATIADGLPYFRDLIERHHAAILDADEGKVMRLREESHDLALQLNGGEPGILADDTSPGNVLARETAATPGTLPLWGQEGNFEIAVGSMKVRITQHGMFGIGSTVLFWPGFAAHAVDWDQLFLSSTGYRSFLGIHAGIVPGLTPDAFCRYVIGSYVETELRGNLCALQ